MVMIMSEDNGMDRPEIENEEGLVSIPLETYHNLLQRSAILACLENAGVDNWEGYSSSFDIMSHFIRPFPHKNE